MWCQIKQYEDLLYNRELFQSSFKVVWIWIQQVLSLPRKWMINADKTGMCNKSVTLLLWVGSLKDILWYWITFILYILCALEMKSQRALSYIYDLQSAGLRWQSLALMWTLTLSVSCRPASGTHCRATRCALSESSLGGASGFSPLFHATLEWRLVCKGRYRRKGECITTWVALILTLNVCSEVALLKKMYPWGNRYYILCYSAQR